MNIYVSLCSPQRPFATMDSFEPHNSLSRSRGWPATSKGNRGHQAALPIGVPWHICTPVTSWVAKEEVSSAPVCPVSDLFLPPLVLPSRFLTLLSPRQEPPRPRRPLSQPLQPVSFLSQPSFSKGLSTLAVFLPHLQFPLQPTAS